MNLPYKVRLSKRSEKFIKEADSETRIRVAKAIDNIKISPTSGTNIKKLKGVTFAYRYRLGSLRILYSVNNDEKRVDIYSTGPRGDIYK